MSQVESADALEAVSWALVFFSFHLQSTEIKTSPLKKWALISIPLTWLLHLFSLFFPLKTRAHIVVFWKLLLCTFFFLFPRKWYKFEFQVKGKMLLSDSTLFIAPDVQKGLEIYLMYLLWPQGKDLSSPIRTHWVCQLFCYPSISTVQRWCEWQTVLVTDGCWGSEDKMFQRCWRRCLQQCSNILQWMQCFQLHVG